LAENGESNGPKDPNELLRKFQQKVNDQAQDDKKRELASNATNQINSIMSMLEANDLKRGGNKGYNEIVMN